MGGSLGFGKSSQQQTSFIDPAQSPFLQFLRGQGQGLATQLQPQFGNLGAFAGDLGQQGQQFIQQLGQSGQLDQFIGQGSTEQQIAGVTSGVQNFLDINRAGIRGQANLAGGFGGSRQAVEQGAATGQAATGLGGIISDILGKDIFRRQQAAVSQRDQDIQSALGGIGGLSELFNLAQGGLTGQFGGLGILAGLIGGPTVLGQSTGKSFNVQTSGGLFGG